MITFSPSGMKPLAHGGKARDPLIMSAMGARGESSGMCSGYFRHFYEFFPIRKTDSLWLLSCTAWTGTQISRLSRLKLFLTPPMRSV